MAVETFDIPVLNQTTTVCIAILFSANKTEMDAILLSFHPNKAHDRIPNHVRYTQEHS